MANPRLELEGKRFGRLAVARYLRTQPNGAVWLCQCDCGNETEVTTGRLTTGNTSSCGCLKRQMVAAKNHKHGLLPRGNRSPELDAFRNAIRRCNDPSHKSYRNYGGRGIKFLFASFDEFLAEVGHRPTRSHSVDRINNEGHYERGNLRWATAKEQAANRRPIAA